jgi:hypothetical protein
VGTRLAGLRQCLHVGAGVANSAEHPAVFRRKRVRCELLGEIFARQHHHPINALVLGLAPKPDAYSKRRTTSARTATAANAAGRGGSLSLPWQSYSAGRGGSPTPGGNAPPQCATRS